MASPGNVHQLEPWLDKHALATYLGCKVRWIEYRVSDGMPHALIAGRWKFKISVVEPWLEEHGHLKRLGENEAA